MQRKYGASATMNQLKAYNDSLSKNTPNYFITLETSVEPSYIYTLTLHLNYIHKILYKYELRRLPNILTNILLQEELFWVKDIKAMAIELNMEWPGLSPDEEQWSSFSLDLIDRLKNQRFNIDMQSKHRTLRIYKHLNHDRTLYYMNGSYSTREISWIMKARSEMIYLNGNKFDANEVERSCSLCNLNEK